MWCKCEMMMMGLEWLFNGPSNEANEKKSVYLMRMYLISISYDDDDFTIFKERNDLLDFSLLSHITIGKFIINIF